MGFIKDRKILIADKKMTLLTFFSPEFRTFSKEQKKSSETFAGVDLMFWFWEPPANMV